MELAAEFRPMRLSPASPFEHGAAVARAVRAAWPTVQRKCVIGNPGGSPEAMRRVVNKAFLQDMRKAWDKLGMKALEKCAKN